MRLTAAVCLCLITGLTLAAPPVAAQEGIFEGMQKGLDFTFASTSTTTTFASGLVTKTETKNLFPALTLSSNALLFPKLRLNAGGVFEVNMLNTTTNDGDTRSTISRNRPFFLLRSTDPVFSPGIGYFRREERSRTAGLSNVKLVNDEYAAYVGWNPAGGPRSDFQFIRSHTFDDQRAFQDVTRGIGTLISDYFYRTLALSYRGSYLSTDDPLRNVRSTQVSHGARVVESVSWLRKRFNWNTMYNVTHQTLTSATIGASGEVAVPLAAFAGLSALSETPTTVRLTDTPALIDANLTAGAGINLGVATPPSNTQPRNVGIDFLNPTEVNRLLVWLDRDLPPEISNTFSWEIYSSTDNVVWRRETAVPVAPFGPFENRFQLEFGNVTARYLKVVTRPLSPAVPDSARFTTILVTELQAFIRRRPDEVSSRIGQTTHLLNTDVRFRLLDSPSLYYEGFSLYNRRSNFDRKTDTLSNGLSINHAFSPVVSVYARAAHEQGMQPQGRRSANVTNAALTVTPVPTFRSSLLYSGQDERLSERSNDRYGIFLQNTAQLYRGVDVVFGGGWNAATRETGEITRDRLLNASATIVPRQQLSLTFSYDDRVSRRSGIFVGAPTATMRRLYGTVSVDPVPSLHLVLGTEVFVMTGQNTRRTLDVITNWSPFPDGTLQLIFAHTEALRPLEFGEERSTLGSIRWNLSRRSYFDVSYQKTSSEFVFLTTNARVFSISMRLFV